MLTPGYCRSTIDGTGPLLGRGHVDVNAQPGEAPKPKRRRRLRRRWVALIIVVAVIVVLVVAAFVTAHYTSRSSFCDSCHEMDPYYASWQSSVHNTAECRNCHIPPGAIAYVQTKLFSFREVWVHITKKVEAPLAVTRQIHNASCLECHKDPGNATLGNVTFSHSIHQSQNCVTCHVRLVHRSVTPPAYVSPAAMSTCLKCHNGTIAPGKCSTCHTPGHEPRGECSSCHNTESWTAAGTNHPFPREGAHAGLACTDCHVAKTGVQLIPGTELPQADPACISCHGDKHGGLTDCATCHTPNGWKPASFTHQQVGEHIPNGEKPLDCASCHTSGFGSASCTPCHNGTPGGD
jgi:nitrate/TMAO reductase-like tetraheme cytochrome c subunit